jgi:prepilin signal peptidase PulO-like enzyme (type II secretory pathway)
MSPRVSDPYCAAIVALVWGVVAYHLARREMKSALGNDSTMHYLVGLALASAALGAILLPAPLGLAVPITIAGLGVAAWSDWCVSYLFDEITVTTAILAGTAMLVGGAGLRSMEGGMTCAGLTSFVYFAALLAGKETGYGDVKAAAAIGFAMGPAGGLLAYFAAAIIFVVAALLHAFRTREATLGVPAPFGPALVLGMIVSAPFTPALDTLLQSLIS